jgi:hypothetical protein
VAPADLAAIDSNATLNPQSTVNTDSIKMNLNIPTATYLDPDKYNVDLARTDIGMGEIEVTKDGAATLAGQPIGGADAFDAECQDGE